MAAGNLRRRCAALSHRHRRLSLRELRHSLVSLQRRANRARMRAADSRPRSQHSIACCQRLTKCGRERGASRYIDRVKTTQSLERLQRWEGKMSVIRTVGLAAGVAATLLGTGPRALAESNYPNRPIHVVVPYPAGGIVDIVARAVTEQVRRDWKQTLVVE